MKPLLSSSDEDFLNYRGKDEIKASNTYRYAATCFQKQGLFGLEKFCRAESAAELEHRTKLEKFANDMGFELDMPSIPAISFKNETPKGILIYLLEMEEELLEEYEKGYKEAERGATKKLCLDMIEIQTSGVGEIMDLLAELESVENGVAFLNQRLYVG